MKLPQVLRSLMIQRAYTASTIAVLGMSIAALLVIVIAIDALLFRAPSARAPQELVIVQSSLPRGIISFPDFDDLRERNHCLSHIFVFRTDANTGIQVGNKLFTVESCLASADLFQALDTMPGEGRYFAPSDDRPNAAPVLVISAEFAHHSGLRVGDLVKISDETFSIIGVTPPGFTALESLRPIDVWIPAEHYEAVLPTWARHNRAFQPVLCGGSLRGGTSLSAASAELATIGAQIAAENPVTNHGMTLRAQSLLAFRYAQQSSTRMVVLLGVLVASLFALAFTNFFALTLLRLLNRHRELAVKVAIGATWGHLARALIAEVLVVAALSTMVGVALAFAILRMTSLDPRVHALLGAAAVRIDLRAIAAISIPVLVCSLVVWGLGLRHAASIDVMRGIKESAAAPRRQAAFSTLLAVQLGLTGFLAVMAISFTAELSKTAHRHYSFRTENELLVDVPFRQLGLTDDARLPAAARFLARLRETPGVETVGACSHAPMTRAGWSNLIVDGHDPALDADKCIANQLQVTDGYFDAAGVKLIAGRTIDAHDVTTKAKVAVIDAAAAHRFWPKRNAVGATFQPWEAGPLYTVIGVVDDVPTSPAGGAFPSVYLTWGTTAGTTLTFYIAVRDDSAAVRREIDRTLHALWPFEGTPPLRSLHEHLAAVGADLVTAVRVILSVAILAGIVTACGLYFFSAYTASQTRRETAVRQALGARPRHLVQAHAARYRVGVITGLLLAVGLLTAARFGVSQLAMPSAPLRWTQVVFGLLAVAAIGVLGLMLPLAKMLRSDVARTLNRS